MRCFYRSACPAPRVACSGGPPRLAQRGRRLAPRSQVYSWKMYGACVCLLSGPIRHSRRGACPSGVAALRPGSGQHASVHVTAFFNSYLDKMASSSELPPETFQALLQLAKDTAGIERNEELRQRGAWVTEAYLQLVLLHELGHLTPAQLHAAIAAYSPSGAAQAVHRLRGQEAPLESASRVPHTPNPTSSKDASEHQLEAKSCHAEQHECPRGSHSGHAESSDEAK